MNNGRENGRYTNGSPVADKGSDKVKDEAIRMGCGGAAFDIKTKSNASGLCSAEWCCLIP